jgi:capsid portal protein
MKLNQNFSVVNMAQQEIPVVTEDTKTRYAWVPVGINDNDDYFASITEGYNTSTTNAASVEGIADMIFGKGIYSKNPAFQPMLDVVLPQEEIKRVSFDIKLYGNGAFQVYWNDEHTKIIRMYHIPVQTLRAEKIYDNPRIENYYYCTDWTDQRKIKDKKKVPVFGTSLEKMEILYIKNYTPGQYYYSLPDWFSALQFSYVEAELSNLHINNIQNGFLPMVMINMNNGIPAPEERDTIESMIESKFTGTRNAGRFILTFNDDKERQPTIEAVQIDNLHEKFKYVAEYAQDRILVAHRVTSPLLFGIRTANNGFSSQSEEMKTAYSILQTMTIIPFQNLIINALTTALAVGGYSDSQLYFEQMTPLVILSQTAEETGQTVEEVQDDINEEAENPAVMEDGGEGVIDPNMDNAPLKASRPAQFGTPEFIKEFR